MPKKITRKSSEFSTEEIEQAAIAGCSLEAIAIVREVDLNEFQMDPAEARRWIDAVARGRQRGCAILVSHLLEHVRRGDKGASDFLLRYLRNE